MSAGGHGVGAGFLLVGALLGANALLSWLTWRSKRAETWLEGRPQIPVHHGVVDE